MAMRYEFSENNTFLEKSRLRHLMFWVLALISTEVALENVLSSASIETSFKSEPDKDVDRWAKVIEIERVDIA